MGTWDMALLEARGRSMRAAGLLIATAQHSALYKQRIVYGRTRCCCELAVQVRWHEPSGELRDERCGPEQSAGALGCPASHMDVQQLHRSVSIASVGTVHSVG